MGREIRLGLTVPESVQRAPRFENILPELKTVLPNIMGAQHTQ
jgi:hypothetical protein